MPHIEANQRLCYLDKDAYYLDPFKPQESLNILLKQINQVLKEIATLEPLEVAHEHAFEFTAYWGASGRVFLASLDEQGLVYKYKRVNFHKNQTVPEWVYLSKDDLQFKSSWLSSVPGLSEQSSKPTHAVFVKSYKDPLIEKGIKWPPQDFKEFFTWFRRIDSNAAKTLLQLVKKTFKQRMLFVFVQFNGEHTIGFTLSKTDYGNSAITSSIHQKKSDRFLNALCSKRMMEPILRLVCENASQEFVLKRNNQFTLKDKKIILIGCGTIGGYLAHSLVQNGAGYGQGKLTLYDPDEYSPANIGRHILGGNYLRQMKSYAMKEFLLRDYYSYGFNIHAKEQFDHNDIDSTSGYDLIIDATGDHQFSTLLSKSWHQAKIRSPLLIHGWIDAAGGAARALLDDDKKACFYCVTSGAEEGGERFQLFKKGAEQSVIRKSCAGSSYFEFSSSASMTAAALILDKAIKGLHKTKQYRFNHVTLSDDIHHTKNQDPERLKRCPCCQT